MKHTVSTPLSEGVSISLFFLPMVRNGHRLGIFGAVTTAIDLTKTILTVIGNWQDASNILRELYREVLNSQLILKEAQKVLHSDEKLRYPLRPLVKSLQDALKELEKGMAPFAKQAAEKGKLKDALKRLLTRLDPSKILRCQDTLWHYTLEIECACLYVCSTYLTCSYQPYRSLSTCSLTRRLHRL